MILRSRRAIVSALLLAALLIGLAQVALLPPWEGFDETAHFSYVAQIADTGTWPQGTEPLSVDVEASSRKTPAGAFLRAWGSYGAFKTASPELLDAARREVHEAPAAPRTWRPGQALNWQKQHPLLYYALLAPVHSATKTWSLAAELFAMRAVSYLIAWLGLVIAAVAALRATQPTPLATITAALAVGLWPLMFPMWFPEMARVGNDSLLVPIVAAAWIAAQPLLRQEGSALRYAALGAILGLGLLTKATVLPVVAVVLVFLAWPLLLALRSGKSIWPLVASCCSRSP
jgi:4-amino-4-deoxy-L-arabinose transferase-like glycosyltransferase